MSIHTPIWVLDCGRDNDDRCLVGVFSSLEEIKNTYRGEWIDEGGYHERKAVYPFTPYLSAILEYLDEPSWNADNHER